MNGKRERLLYCVLFGFLGQLAFGECQNGFTRWSFSNLEKTMGFNLCLEKNRLSYSVDRITPQGKIQIIEPSPLGLLRRDEDFTQGLHFISASKPKVFDETYRMITGKRRILRNHGVERIFRFENTHNARLDLIVRAYPDGIAFRYRFPETSNSLYTILREETGFNLPDTGEAWMLPYSRVDVWAPAYEAEWENAIPIGTHAPEYVGWSFPALFYTHGNWVLLTEADVSPAYFASHLEAECTGGLYRIRMPEDEETYGLAPKEPSSTLPWETPWRVIVIGENPGVMIETNLVTHLSRPCMLRDTSWIKPGRASWSWWSDVESPWNYNKLLPFIDLSAQMGWEYSLIDLGWHAMQNGTLQDLIQYAKERNVELLLWYNSGGEHNRVDAWRVGIMDNPIRRKEEMARISRLGIRGIKVDFMQSDKQYLMKLYEDILRDAADYHLVVNFHGATIPRGWMRTYPHLLTMEAIRGAEQYWDQNFAENAHCFHTIYPFTRNAIGSMDYTPVILGEGKFPNRLPHKTTSAHELALSVIFESGIQHFIDTPDSYLSQPEPVIDFLKHIPVAWDETKYIDGWPGKLCILARRYGREWYLGGINGETREKNVSVPLAFLSKGEYTGILIMDGDTVHSFNIQTLSLTPSTVLSVRLAARGGFVGWILPK